MNNLLKKSIEEYQKTQDLVYEIEKLSNEIRIISKTAIALLRRDNIVESKNNIKKAEKLFRSINEITKKSKDLISKSSYKEAVEEYIEAIIFYNFLTKSKKEIPNFIESKPENIISGICDFTGELVRRAVNIANSDNLKKLILYRKAIESIAEELTKIGFKGKIRQKYDETERNLKKIENILYDIRLKT